LVNLKKQIIVIVIVIAYDRCNCNLIVIEQIVIDPCLEDSGVRVKVEESMFGNGVRSRAPYRRDV
jgi:hypothetical protein